MRKIVFVISVEYYWVSAPQCNPLPVSAGKSLFSTTPVLTVSNIQWCKNLEPISCLRTVSHGGRVSPSGLGVSCSGYILSLSAEPLAIFTGSLLQTVSPIIRICLVFRNIWILLNSSYEQLQDGSSAFYVLKCIFYIYIFITTSILS